MILAEIVQTLWETEGRRICAAPGCSAHDDESAIGDCDWCHQPVCIEHDDVLENRDIDSDLTLCQPCGDKFDQQNGVTFDEDGLPQIYGPPWGRNAEIARR